MGVSAKFQSRHVYVVIHTTVSLLVFARNLAFMRTLDLFDLGQIALMQTIVMFVGFSHMGLITGAYLQYARSDANQRQVLVDNTMMVGFGFLALMLGLSTLGLFGWIEVPQMMPQTLAIGLTAGAFTLLTNLLNNILVADQKLLQSNFVNIIAIFVSLGAAFASIEYGLPAALLSMLLQPLTLMILIPIVAKQARPRLRMPDPKVLSHAFRLGFPGFCSGVFLLILYQIERWTIAIELGSEALGQFYIVLIYSTFFTLVPASLLNVRTPPAVRASHNNDYTELRLLLWQHLRDLLLYCLLASAITLVFMKPLVGLVLPGFLDQTPLVLLIIPAMILLVLQDVPSLYFTSRTDLKPIMLASAIGLVVYVCIVFALWTTQNLSLEIMAVVRSLAMAAGGGALVILWYRSQRRKLLAGQAQ